MSRRWLITGTRHGRVGVARALTHWARLDGPPTELVLGDARGVDQQAYAWARENDIPFKAFAARWATEGRSAGPKRNQLMVDHCSPGDLCLAFPASQSRGTADCYRRAQAAGLQCEWLEPELDLRRLRVTKPGHNPDTGSAETTNPAEAGLQRVESNE